MVGIRPQAARDRQGTGGAQYHPPTPRACTSSEMETGTSSRSALPRHRVGVGAGRGPNQMPPGWVWWLPAFSIGPVLAPPPPPPALDLGTLGI